MINFSFEDEASYFFSYHSEQKHIETAFHGYNSILPFEHANVDCRLIIENWKAAKSRVVGSERFFDLDYNMGVISMIHHIKHAEDGSLELVANTLDNRYIEFIFLEAKVTLIT